MIHKISYKGKVTKNNADKVAHALANAIYGVTCDKDGKEVYPDYCHQCKYAKSRYDHSESFCSNKKSESHEERVRSWDTSCKLFKELTNPTQG